MVFQGAPELSRDTSRVGAYVEEEAKRVGLEGPLTNANPASLLVQKIFLAFDFRRAAQIRELNLEHFSLDLANARERVMVIIKAFGKLRLWSMI